MRYKKHRVLVAAWLALVSFGFGLGLHAVALQLDDVRVLAVARQAFAYSGLGRELFPAMLASYLRHTKYAPFAQVSRPAFAVPGLAEGYVPQGLCYAEALDAFLLTAYYPNGERPSMLAVVDRASGVCTKQLYLQTPGSLPFVGHVGGVAAWQKHIFVSSESRVWRLEAEDVQGAPTRTAVRIRDSFNPSSRGSFVFCADNVLWVGDSYSPTKSKEVPPQKRDANGNKAWCTGFLLDADSPMGVADVRFSGATPVPRYVLSIPHCVQGAACSSTGELLLSTSIAARLPSWLLVFPSLARTLRRTPDSFVAVAGQQRPLWVLNENAVLRRQQLAPMSEGIAVLRGQVFVLFESAAIKYRGKAELFADYVFALDDKLEGPN